MIISFKIHKDLSTDYQLHFQKLYLFWQQYSWVL